MCRGRAGPAVLCPLSDTSIHACCSSSLARPPATPTPSAIQHHPAPHPRTRASPRRKDINRLSHNARKHKDTNQAIDNVAVLVAAAARLERESVTLTAANRATAKAGHRGSTIMVGVE